MNRKSKHNSPTGVKILAYYKPKVMFSKSLLFLLLHRFFPEQNLGVSAEALKNIHPSAFVNI